MTREELERRVRMLLPLGTMKRAEAEATADAVIRLVVEACCERVTAVRDRLLGGDFTAAAGGAEVARNDLMKSFLPTQDPANG